MLLGPLYQDSELSFHHLFRLFFDIILLESYCTGMHINFSKISFCWSRAPPEIFSMSLGKVVLGMDTMYSIILSAGIALFYTVIGGLYSVAYTGKCLDDHFRHMSTGL